MSQHPVPIEVPLRRNIEIVDLHTVGGTQNYAVHDLAEALQAAGMSRATRVLGCGGNSPVARVATRCKLNRNFARSSRSYLVPMMGPMESWLFPYSLVGNVVPVCWDVWEPNRGKWLDIFRRHCVRHAFVSARTSATRLSSDLPGLQAVWMPEATNVPPGSPGKPLSERSIGVIELGRRDPKFHERVTHGLAADKIRHLYEPAKGHVIFGSRNEMIDGLQDAVISVCFPSSVTHPERSGDVETLTQRYLESICAGAIVFGSAPAELIELFGYDPIVNALPGSELAQIKQILASPARYQGLVEKNYTRLVEVGTWSRRAGDVLGQLNRWGFYSDDHHLDKSGMLPDGTRLERR